MNRIVIEMIWIRSLEIGSSHIMGAAVLPILLKTTVKCRTFHGSGSKLDMNRIHIEMIWIRSIEIGSPHIMGAAVLPIVENYCKVSHIPQICIFKAIHS